MNYTNYFASILTFEEVILGLPLRKGSLGVGR